MLSVSSAADADLTQPERFPCSSESERVSEKRDLLRYLNGSGKYSLRVQ